MVARSTAAVARRAVMEHWRDARTTESIEATGSSMVPFIRSGDHLVVEFGPSAPHHGDVVVFAGDGIIVAHRVVAVTAGAGPSEQMLITKGDGEPYATEALRTSHLLGIVRAVDRDGLPETRGLGDRSGRAAALLSRTAGILERASRRRGFPTQIVLGRAAAMVRAVLFRWTTTLAEARVVTSSEGGR